VLLQPGANLEQVQAAVRDRLPEDIAVYTKAEIIRKEAQYWIQTTSIGFIFGLGVLVSFVVGTVIVYQILYTDIRDHLREYATLKAMGYGSGYLFKTVLQEALILAVMGYIPGFLLAIGLYRFTDQATAGALPMEMGLPRTLFVLSLTVLMCGLSGLISVRRAVSADPAEVFA